MQFYIDRSGGRTKPFSAADVALVISDKEGIVTYAASPGAVEIPKALTVAALATGVFKSTYARADRINPDHRDAVRLFLNRLYDAKESWV